MPRNIAGSKLGNGVISLLSWIIPISLIVTPIMANFHLYPIQLWWQFFQIFRMAMWFMPKLGRCWCWPWKTVSSHLNTPVQPMFLHRMAVFSFWLFRKNLCDSVARMFWANANQFTPPAWQKIARTPMLAFCQFASVNFEPCQTFTIDPSCKALKGVWMRFGLAQMEVRQVRLDICLYIVQDIGKERKYNSRAKS